MTTDGVTNSNGSVQVATVALTLTSSTANLGIAASTLTIAGFGFDTNTANDSVSFSDGAVGTVTSATTSTLTVGFTTQPAAAGSLTAAVTTDGFTNTNGSQQVATVIYNPIQDSSSTITVNGSGFSTAIGSDSVSFNLGVVGTVSSATSSQLIVTVTTPPTALGNLTAVVTVSGTSGSPIQVGTEVNGTWVVNSRIGGPGNGGGSMSLITLPYLLGGYNFLRSGSISGNVLTISTINGSVGIGTTLVGAGAAAGTVVTGFDGGTGNAGTYFVNISQSVSLSGAAITPTVALSGDTITFASSLSGQTITLQGEVSLSGNLTIVGLGANALAISGRNTDSFTANTTSVGLFYTGGTAAITTSISGLTLENASALFLGGPAFDNSDTNSTVTLANDIIKNSFTTPTGNSGAINNNGTITLNNDLFTSNSVGSATGGSAGGAIENGAGGTATLNNDTFSNNSAYYYGGAVANISNGVITITNCTFFDNSATNDGGAVYNSSTGAMTLVNDTITGNSSPAGGGVYNSGSSVTILNSVVAGNTGTTGTDIDGTIANASYDLIGVTTGFTGTNTLGNLNTTAGLATTLGNNGGPTQTLALLSTSPAINAGGAAVTTLSALINSTSATTISVANAAAFAVATPTTGVYIWVGSEEMLVTGVSGTTLTVALRKMEPRLALIIMVPRFTWPPTSAASPGPLPPPPTTSVPTSCKR